ncbi:MAG: hypothetical protein AABY22_26950, partial [Nanoarchaeota archaeon]
EKNNIPADAFITGFVFRNQLRKEVRPLMEGFAQFQKENPKVKSYLLLHTYWSEPGGWGLTRFIEELGIKKESILTTHVCSHCHNYEVKSYAGDLVNCKFCGSEKTVTTCQVNNGITEKELNEVYNLMDCYAHGMNAGGLEIPICEALYSELPLATVGYSSGEMFTDQAFVYPIKFTYTVQHQTQFLRAVPQSDSICKFLTKINNMSAEERENLGKRCREWAINKFNVNVIGKQWEDYIDSLPDHNWDFKFESDIKNVNADIRDIEENENDDFFIKECYKRILNMEISNNQDSGFLHWQQFLNN